MATSNPVSANVVQPIRPPLTQQSSVQPWSPNYPYVSPSYWTVSDPDGGRLRFALELIAEGGLTHDAVKKIAEKALRKPPKK